VFDLFLPILDEGRLSDSDGRVVDFRNCMIVFTSNIGADLLQRAGGRVEQQAIFDALRQHFRPELINRIDEIVPFYSLLFEDVRAILKNMIDQVRLRVQDRDIKLRMFQGAYEFLANEGYSAEFGARELRRAVERHVVTPISERLLIGEFGRGDVIEVLVENGELVYRKGERRGVPVEMAR
jgi:ATP-dependent Clp protease ATP-binding subunit ClpA